MSDRIRPLPIGTLLATALSEHTVSGTLFGVFPYFRGDPKKALPLFDREVEVPFGPAAGPHTQLAQNILSAYVGGARYFELKTVQTLDGEDLPVLKPCISAADEGRNVEWSTELTVSQALDEYVKAWFLLKLFSREFGLGGENGFVFNASVGYDRAGICSPKIDAFLNGLACASTLPIWAECQHAARALLPRLHNVDEAYLAHMDSHVCTSVTLSTLHGCSAGEIESIASHLLSEKGLHTFVKLNPTLLGYDFCRATLDGLGYSFSFDARHFEADLQFDDAVPMLTRLRTLADARGLSFGVKLTNTLPVDITNGELPGQEMYLSGKVLAPLTLTLCERLSRAFAGGLRISYSGGADAFNIRDIVAAGVWPVTVATTLLKPGGYQRLTQMAKTLLSMDCSPFTAVDTDAIAALSASARSEPRYKHSPQGFRKLNAPLPLLDCFTAPCQSGCPISHEIPTYIRLLGEGRRAEALRLILDRNPLPHITGTICAHPCMSKCMRAYYDSPVHIRDVKLCAVEAGWESVLPEVKPLADRPELKVAVAGGGPAGMAVAFFLARMGARVTLFELRQALGGVVRHLIPDFRISADAIDADAQLLSQVGVEILLNTPAPGPSALKNQGFTHLVLAVGAWSPGYLPLEGRPAMNALDFLGRCKDWGRLHRKPRNIVVVGGGNTAMDAARMAKRMPDTESVTLVYRRTRDLMPADVEKLELALREGVGLRELLAPVSWNNRLLTCSVLLLGAPDASGRRSPEPTGETVDILTDLVVSAVGDHVDADVLDCYGVDTEPTHGLPLIRAGSLEAASAPGVYLAGDVRRGPATVVEAIADAADVAAAILGKSPFTHRPLPAGRRGSALAKHGLLRSFTSPREEDDRCLECATLCEACVESCPNRANVSVTVPTRRQSQIVHVDGMCNECGNCAVFCPYEGAPYRDKFTVFGTVEAFYGSKNDGFVLLDQTETLVRVRLDGVTIDAVLTDEGSPLPSGVQELIETILANYPYLLY